MAALFSPKVPSPPKADDPAIAEARRRALLVEKNRKGRSSTILTGPSGISGDTLAPEPTTLGS